MILYISLCFILVVLGELFYRYVYYYCCEFINVLYYLNCHLHS